MYVCPECGATRPGPAHCTSDGSQLLPVGEDVLLGQTIGAYRVARLLGVGGMGRVYKGVHPQIGSRVAIKVLSRECSDRRDLVDRFFAEAKAVNLIRHESIVNVLDLATLPDGRPYIVMEYLDGSPLASIVDHALHRRALLPLGGVARLAAEVLDALGAAHAKGVVHRDLKPDNIYVTPAGRAKVLDFGIAKLQPELGGSATHTGSLLGTPHYMAPEQASGRPVDHRADLYSIGVILFECMTLRKPFVADSLFDLLRKHVEAPPPSPRALRPDIPPELEQVIYTALAKQPEQRFASAQAMSVALQQATSRLPPDQWTPIVPDAGANRSTGGGWAPAPPTSWTTNQRQQQQPTQTAGQVTAPAKKGSRKGVWIALAAIMLVGGGVTAVVLAGGGGSGSEPKVTAAEPAPTQPVAPAVPVPAPQPAAPAAPVPAPQPAAPAPVAAGDDSDDDDVADQLDEVLGMLPAEQRKLLPTSIQAALKKYGTWAKIPAAERKKLAGDFAGLGNLAGAAGDEVNAALAAGPAARPAPSALGPDQWIKYTPLAPPGAFDPKHLDAASYLPYALGQAKQLIPDARLFRIDVSGVFPDGHADLTIVGNGSLDFRFISPSRAARDPKLPIGAKVEAKCMFRVIVEKDGVATLPMNGWDCKEKPLPAPRCSFKQVWNKALAKGAPRNAVASLGYRANFDGVATWYFDIAGSTSEMFKDDC